jgi:hypothetical protein
MSKMNEEKQFQATRGYGVLENFLSRQRSNVANRLIPDSLRRGKILDIGCGTFPLFLNKVAVKEKYAIDKVDCQVAGNIQFVRHDFEMICSAF